MIQISEAEYNELRACRQMLCQISVYVEHFCNEEDTTLMGVLRLLAEYHSLKSLEMYHSLDQLKEQQEVEE